MQLGIRSRFQANITEDGAIVLNARLFGDIIRKMPDDMIVFEADDKMMVSVTCGDADFPSWASAPTTSPSCPTWRTILLHLKQNVLKGMIGGTSFAVSTNETASSTPAPCSRSATASSPW